MTVNQTRKDCIRAVVGLAALLYSLVSFADEISCTVQFRTVVPVELLAQGKVKAVNADVGQTIAGGDTLIELDSTLQQARVQAKQSEVDLQVIEVESLKSLHQKYKELLKRRSLSYRELDASEQTIAIEEVKLQAFEAELAIAEFELGLTTVEAPFDAVVVSRRIEPGMIVAHSSKTQRWMTVAKANEYVARAVVSYDTRVKLVPGEQYVVKLGDRQYTATMELPTLQQKSKRWHRKQDDESKFLVDFAFQETDNSIIPGAPATVDIE